MVSGVEKLQLEQWIEQVVVSCVEEQVLVYLEFLVEVLAVLLLVELEPVLVVLLLVELEPVHDKVHNNLHVQVHPVAVLYINLVQNRCLP